MTKIFYQCKIANFVSTNLQSQQTVDWRKELPFLCLQKRSFQLCTRWKSFNLFKELWVTIGNLKPIHIMKKINLHQLFILGIFGLIC